MVWRAAIAVLGVLIVAFTLRDVFRDLFHPTHSGSLSDWIAKGAALTRRIHTSFKPTVRPLALVGAIFIWVILITFGFALIYFGLDSVAGISGHGEGLGGQFIRALSLSMGSLVTFQTVDVYPTAMWMHMLFALEGFIGFALITASISWTVLLYPALARSRWLARRINLLLQAQEQSGILAEEAISPEVLLDFARDLVEIRIDLRLWPILFAFYSSEQNIAIADTLPHLVRLAQMGSEPHQPVQLRLAAAQLDIAIAEFAELVADTVLGVAAQSLPRAEIVRRFAERD